MRRSSVTIGMLIIFIVGFAVGKYFMLSYENSTFKSFYWLKDPIILNCHGEDMSLIRVKKALRYWDDMGYEYKKYVHRPDKKACDGPKLIEGYVTLRKADPDQLDFDILAFTTRRHASAEMKGATIYFKKNTEGLELLLEHELGHAYGFTHVTIPGHIMHPNYDIMGKRFWIPD